MDVFAQIIGILGMAAAVVSYQCKTNRNYFIWQGLSGFCFSIQFVMIGAWAGLAFNVYNIVRAIVNQTRFSRSVPCIVALELLVVGAASLSVFVFQETWWLVLLAFVAQAAGTFAMWTKNGKTIRISQLAVVSPLWLLYDLLIPTPSIGGILCEGFNIVSVIVSFVRFRKSGFDKT